MWAASTATWLSFPKARWAFMKTSMLAMALDMGRTDFRAAHARGFVSMITVNSDGVCPLKELSS